MTGKALHKTGVTIAATVATSHIGIDTVIEAGDSRFGQNSFGEDFSYFHNEF
jgi:hypothetical protein